MTLNVNNAWGRQAVEQNQVINRWQFNVRTGCSVSINTGTLGQTDTLSVASGDITFNGSAVSVGSQNTQIDAADATHPRKDVVYLDSTGTAQVAKGTPEAARPSNKTGRETYRPRPPDLSSTNAVVLAEVWVPAGASSVSASDLTDRRLLADISTAKVQTGEVVSDKGVSVLRNRYRSISNRIRNTAGLSPSSPVGPQNTAGVSNSTALSASSRISVTSDAEASSAASSGDGSRDNPYIIKDKDLDNSEATSSEGGFHFDDPDATYHVVVQNFKVHGYNRGQITVDAFGEDAANPGTLTFKEGQVWLDGGNLDLAFVYGGYDITFKQIQFSGSGSGHNIHAGHPDHSPRTTVRVEDCVFDEAKEATTNSVLYCRGVGSLLTRFNKIDSAITEHVLQHKKHPFYLLMEGWDMQGGKRLIHSPSNVTDAISGRIVRNNCVAANDYYIAIFGPTHFYNEVAPLNQGWSLEIAENDFDDAPSGNRLVFLDDDDNGSAPSDVIIRDNWGKKTTGSGPNNECFEAFAGRNIVMERNYVSECTEDAYEFVKVESGAARWNVADNCTGQIVDVFRDSVTAGSSSKIEVTGVFGESTGDVAVMVTACDDVTVSTVLAKTSSHCVEFDQGNASAGFATSCVVEGPLALASVVGGDIVKETGDYGTIEAQYLDQEATQTPFETPAQTQLR